jgi:hypothetical protein
MTSFATRRGAAPKSAAQWGKSPDTASCGRYFLGVGNMSLALLSDTDLDAVTGGGFGFGIGNHNHIDHTGPTIQVNVVGHLSGSNNVVVQSNTDSSVNSGNIVLV